MGDIILHHYDASSYSQKIRSILGYKNMSWHSVLQPDAMPKPDLTALTGGYRLLPVLQIGSDIYCDTKCIARRLEREVAQPPLYCGPDATLRGLSVWGESVFFSLVTIALSEGQFSDAFVKDRQEMSGPGFNPETAKKFVAWRTTQLRQHLNAIENQLGDGSTYLLGENATIADFSIFHPLWTIETMSIASELTSFPMVQAWLDRMRAIGEGKREELSTDKAIDVAMKSTPSSVDNVQAQNQTELPPSTTVKVRHEAYNGGPVSGELVWSDSEDIGIRRIDERAGELIVHFPKEGFIVTQTS